MDQAETVMVRMTGICKYYPGVRALEGVDFSVRRGEVRALMGENGAGKSTLIKILTGAEPATSGSLEIDGAPVERMTPAVSERLGIACVYQNLVLAEHLTVAENIWMGLMPSRFGFLSRRHLAQKTEEILDRIGYRGTIRPGDRVGDLSASRQGMVAIARAISRDARVVIFDEPTAVLADREVKELFRVIRRLREDGLAVVYISHRMEEIFEISDAVTVLKDGRNAGEVATRETNEEELIRMMVGRELTAGHYDASRTLGEELLRARNVSNRRLHDCSLVLHAGEIVGLYGLVGSGRTELSRALFGCDPIDFGEIAVGGGRVSLRGPRAAIDRGMSLVPEDRRRHGLALGLPVLHNLNLPVYRRHSPSGIIRTGREQAIAREQIAGLAIRTPSPRQRVRNLSGGNQQKVVVGKWLASRARIFLMDEPTNGVDVGAKEEIYGIINRLSREGAGVLFISSYMPELMDLCDRILVMNRGRVAADVPRAEFSEEKLLGLAIRQAD